MKKATETEKSSGKWPWIITVSIAMLTLAVAGATCLLVDNLQENSKSISKMKTLKDANFFQSDAATAPVMDDWEKKEEARKLAVAQARKTKTTVNQKEIGQADRTNSLKTSSLLTQSFKLFGQGWNLEEHGRYVQAVEVYKKAQALAIQDKKERHSDDFNSNWQIARYDSSIAGCYYKMGNYKAAEVAMTKAITQCPAPHFYEKRAQVYRQLLKPQLAVADLKEGARLRNEAPYGETVDAGSMGK